MSQNQEIPDQSGIKKSLKKIKNNLYNRST